ncbi:cytochrome P450 [Phaeosphaeriaceae sp. PMI808]|nr:cytochrome P450 [Phaeosphaeriaceae sp. PMI808]
MASEETTSSWTLPVIAGAIATYWVFATLANLMNAPQLPTSIPWQGYGKGWLGGLRNFFAVTKGKEWLSTGYERYSKNNKIFAEIVMPTSQMSWMLDQPDSVLSTSEAHYDLLQGEYAFIEPIILRDPYHEHVVHKSLVRNLNAIILDLEEELPIAVEAAYGVDTNGYQKFDVMDFFMRLVPRLTNRMLVGPELCREQKYLDAVIAFTVDVIRTQAIMPLFPKVFHSVIGPLLGLPSKYHYWLSSRFTLPMIKGRLIDLEQKDRGLFAYRSWKEPHDFITWSIRTAQAEGRRAELDPVRIAQRIMPLNFAAIHTTSLTGYETMVNILSADPNVIESLREEAYHILQEEGGWTKKGLSRMHRIDSTIRESQRLSPIALTFSHRKVVAKEGIITPEGTHIKCGTTLACPWTPIANDEEYHGPTEFDAFRYSRAKEQYEAMTPEEKEKVDTLKMKQTGLVTTSNQHLPFGHGRHACPGRFFVSNELKMAFAYLLLNYDFKPLKERPKKLLLVRYQVPLPAQIELKRRTSMWQGPE